MPEIYKIRIEEMNNGKEYTHEIYLLAKSQAEANTWAINYTKDFYEMDFVDTDGWYAAEGGALLWRLRSVKQDAKMLLYDTNDKLHKAHLVLLNNNTPEIQ